MRHRKARLQLNRFTSWRKATLKSLVRNLLIHQSIRTTKTKATAAKVLVDRLISLAKQNTLFAKRRAFRILGDHKLVRLLFSDIAIRFNNRTSGFTRILNLGVRRGDNAELAILELTEIIRKERKRPKKQKEVKDEEEKPLEEKKPKAEVKVLEKPPVIKKEPHKKFLGGLRKIFKKERDSL